MQLIHSIYITYVFEWSGEQCRLFISSTAPSVRTCCVFESFTSFAGTGFLSGFVICLCVVWCEIAWTVFLYFSYLCICTSRWVRSATIPKVEVALVLNCVRDAVWTILSVFPNCWAFLTRAFQSRVLSVLRWHYVFFYCEDLESFDMSGSCRFIHSLHSNHMCLTRVCIQLFFLL